MPHFLKTSVALTPLSTSLLLPLICRGPDTREGAGGRGWGRLKMGRVTMFSLLPVIVDVAGTVCLLHKWMWFFLSQGKCSAERSHCGVHIFKMKATIWSRFIEVIHKEKLCVIVVSSGGSLVFQFKAWFVCKSWSRLRPDTASRLRSASCRREAKMLGPCWKRWRRGRSSMSSLTAHTKHRRTSSSRWPAQTPHNKQSKSKKTNPIRFSFTGEQSLACVFTLLLVSFSLYAGLVKSLSVKSRTED